MFTSTLSPPQDPFPMLLPSSVDVIAAAPALEQDLQLATPFTRLLRGRSEIGLELLLIY